MARGVGLNRLLTFLSMTQTLETRVRDKGDP
jgi:hypothetical protein